MRFEKEFTVNSHLCDVNGIVRPGGMMTLMQECANLQLESLGAGYDVLKSSGRFFVLSRLYVRFYAPLRAYETVTCASWPLAGRGYSFPRSYRVARNGETVAEASSVWAYLDLATRRPLRTTEFSYPLIPEEDPTAATPPRMNPQNAQWCDVGRYTVRYVDADRNRHMNNTVYPDMLCGFLPMDGRRVETLSINYQNEAPLGETLTVFLSSHGDEHLFRTVREDGKTNVEALITLTDLA